VEQSQLNQKENKPMESRAPDLTQPIELRIERTFDAPQEMVFDAWADHDQAVKWHGPEGFTVPTCEMDVSEGGIYRMCMREPDGTDHIVTGQYVVVDRPNRLVFSWAWEEEGVAGHATEVTVEFTANGDKTDIVLIHRGFESEESMNGHNMGWTSSFDSLAKLLAA